MMKNWLFKQSRFKIFIYVILAPAILQLVVANIMFTTSKVSYLYMLFVIIGACFLPYFYWLRKSINLLTVYSKEYVTINSKGIDVSFLLVLGTIINFIVFGAYLFGARIDHIKPDINVLKILLCIQFIGTIASGYLGFNVAKLICALKFKRKPFFTEAIGFLLIASFPPLAIWVIQNLFEEQRRIK